MRRFVAYSPIAAVLLVYVLSPKCYPHPLFPYSQNPSYESPWFSCDGDCIVVLTNAIRLARRSILVEGYRIGPRPVLSTLAQAEEAGIQVQTVVEPGRTRYPGATVSQHSQGGRRDPNYAVDRPELLVIDNRQVIKVFFGSGRGHGRSVKSLFVIWDRDLALAYTHDLGATRR
jgi:hypothetical protein